MIIKRAGDFESEMIGGEPAELTILRTNSIPSGVVGGQLTKTRQLN